MVQVVAFPRTLAHTGEHGITPVGLGDVVDQLHDQDGFAHTGAAEQTDFSTLGIGCQQVHNLNPRHQNFRIGGLVLKIGGFAVNAPAGLALNSLALVNGVAQHVKNTAQGFFAHGHSNGGPAVHNVLTTGQTVGYIHGQTADFTVTQMLRNLQNQQLAMIVHMQGVFDIRQRGGKFNINYGPHNLGNFSYVLVRHQGFPFI